jgi:transcriptional regulator GlxA family with amidase domain
LIEIVRQHLLYSRTKNHSDNEVKEAQEFIEKNYAEKISVDDLANKVSVGRRSFERRFKLATNNTVLEYIHRIKMEAAKRSLKQAEKILMK